MGRRVDISGPVGAVGAACRARRPGRGGMSLSTRLLLIIATCLLPILALQAFLNWSQLAARKARLDGLAVQQAQLLAGNVDGIAQGARILLSAAALSRQVRRARPECTERLAALAQ